jgi:hypothetical protein
LVLVVYVCAFFMTPLGGAGNNILLLGGHAGGRERDIFFFTATPKVDCLIRLIRSKAKINPKETHARPQEVQEVGNYWAPSKYGSKW